MHLSLSHLNDSEVSVKPVSIHYDEIVIKKIRSGLKVYVSFFEEEDERRTNHTMLYTYNSKKILQRVEQKINNGNFKIQWDRTENLSHLINELSFKLSRDYTLDFINALMSILPVELRKNTSMNQSVSQNNVYKTG